MNGLMFRSARAVAATNGTTTTTATRRPALPSSHSLLKPRTNPAAASRPAGTTSHRCLANAPSGEPVCSSRALGPREYPYTMVNTEYGIARGENVVAPLRSSPLSARGATTTRSPTPSTCTQLSNPNRSGRKSTAIATQAAAHFTRRLARASLPRPKSVCANHRNVADRLLYSASVTLATYRPHARPPVTMIRHAASVDSADRKSRSE